MAVLTSRGADGPDAPQRPGIRRRDPYDAPTRRRAVERPNYVSGVLTSVWLLIVAVPIVLMIFWSLERRSDYQKGPFSLPNSITVDNVREVWRFGFSTYMGNTAIVTAGSVALMLVLALPAAYGIVRSTSWFAGAAFRGFLIGLAIPAQATIIPVYWMMDQLGLFETLTAIILPTVAFQLPLVVLILSGALRDVSRELYEAMTVDGAGAFRIFWRLVLPMSRGSISTVCIFTGINAWNGFLFPLILTSEQGSRVVTLGLWNFQGQFAINIPGLMMAVLISTLPVFLLYLVARRWLVAGLAGVGGK
ncbi:carbohydrate ABC transporter permease [Micromonospora sp. NPDC049679]|uniref:carbohydrate ABC transporter permease n=1 Tax=Micromonospora sp. NPDC049679 TaxID=3155920 RepID=UPI0033F4B920